MIKRNNKRNNFYWYDFNFYVLISLIKFNYYLIPETKIAQVKIFTWVLKFARKKDSFKSYLVYGAGGGT